jgi:hypothetical protein
MGMDHLARERRLEQKDLVHLTAYSLPCVTIPYGWTDALISMHEYAPLEIFTLSFTQLWNFTVAAIVEEPPLTCCLKRLYR